MSDWKSRAVPAKPEDWVGTAATAKDWKPEQRVETQQSIPETALHSFGHGASFGLTDELRGLMAGTGEGQQIIREKLGLEEGVSPRSTLQRVLDAYREERGSARKDLAKGRQDNPGTAFTAELAGALMAPTPKVAALPAGATRLERMAAMGKAAIPVGAAFGLGNSEADLTQGDVGGAVKDTAVGAGLAGLTSSILGGALHGPLSKLEGKEREAIDKAGMMAREAFDKPQRQAQGALGGVVQTGHRDIEAARDALADEALDPALRQQLSDYLASQEGIALRNRVMSAKAESMPGKLSEIDAKQAAFDAARAANTPEAVEREVQRILGPERFKDATMMRLKKYAGRVAPPFIGSAIGGAIGGPEGAMGGALAGSIASAALGSPGTALANYMRDPAVMLRMAQAGQSPVTNQLPAKAASSLATDEEGHRMLARYLGLLGENP